MLLNSDPVTALKSTFIQTNAALLVTKVNYMTSGCTCVAVYVKDTKLYVANVGDSRAVMAYRPTPPAADAAATAEVTAAATPVDEEPAAPADGGAPPIPAVPADAEADADAEVAAAAPVVIDGADRFLARDLTRDHKPDDPEEMARILSWGGYVCPPAEVGLSARVYLDPGFTMIGLAMARSIGEFECVLVHVHYTVWCVLWGGCI